MEVKDIAEIVWEQIKANDEALKSKKVTPEIVVEPAEA
jgi:hypothetical protein